MFVNYKCKPVFLQSLVTNAEQRGQTLGTEAASTEAAQEGALAFPQGVCTQGLVEGAPAHALSQVPVPLWDPEAELRGTLTFARQFQ